jgi:hypothetical protein
VKPGMGGRVWGRPRGSESLLVPSCPQLIRFNNCLQSLTCVWSLLSCCIPELREPADVLRRVSDLVYCR